MKDFDFDELDKAVNGVLGGEAKGSDTDNIVTDADSNKPDAAAKGPKATEEPKKEKATETATTDKTDTAKSAAAESTPVIVKPRSSVNRNPQPSLTKGGAVDIVAPSKRSSRDGATIAPFRPLDDAGSASADTPKPERPEDSALRWPPRPEATETKPEEKTAKEDTVAPATETTSPEPARPATSTPNDEGSFERFNGLSRSGLDFDQPTSAATPEIASPASPAPATPEADTSQVPADKSLDTAEQTSTDAKTSDEEAEDKPAAENKSPFLSDTKVEKRPLGSYSDQTSTEATPPDPDKAAQSSKEESAASSEVPTADSFRPDHMLEDGHEHEQTKAAKTEEAAPEKTSANAMGSIPQQYKVAAEQKGDASHPVFDTKEYHASAPANKPASGKGSNVFLIISIILLVLAIAAAAVIYFYGEELGLALPDLGESLTSSL